jgi:hypothetical protein
VTDVKINFETALVQAQRCARLVDVMKRQGARRGRRVQTAALAAALAEVEQLGAEVCAGGWTPDERIEELTRRFDQVSALLLEEITPCGPKPC